MSEAKRARIRKALIRSLGFSSRPQVKLTPDEIRKLEQLEHVESVFPIVQFAGEAIMDGKANGAFTISVAPTTRFFGDRLIAGRLFHPEDGRAAIVHEYLLYRWGLVRDEDAVAVLGRSFRFEFRPRSPDTLDLSGLISRKDGTIDPREKEALASVMKRLAVLVPIPTVSPPGARRASLAIRSFRRDIHHKTREDLYRGLYDRRRGPRARRERQGRGDLRGMVHREERHLAPDRHGGRVRDEKFRSSSRRRGSTPSS